MVLQAAVQTRNICINFGGNIGLDINTNPECHKTTDPDTARGNSMGPYVPIASGSRQYRPLRSAWPRVAATDAHMVSVASQTMDVLWTSVVTWTIDIDTDLAAAEPLIQA